MPKLFVGNSLRKVAERVPGLEQTLWGIEALLISIAMAISRLLPPDRTSAAGRRSPLGPRHRTAPRQDAQTKTQS
jgi:hypothetical protein